MLTAKLGNGAPPERSARLARFFFAAAVAGFGAALVCGVGWFFASRPASDVELDDDDRQQLLGELLARSPGLYVPAFFEPRIGYVLRPSAELSAWGTRFRSNSLGFRSPRVGKRPRAFRVVCVGDSWTFGMGVTDGEAYPARLGELAKRMGVERAETWNLALPGYNTFNQVAALEYFLDVLQPDAVVLAPTMNDIDSTLAVLPNGSLTSSGATYDAFGEPHAHGYRVRLIDSHTYLDRWRRAMAEIRRLERRLSRRGIPLVLFFTGRWRDSFVHRLVQQAELPVPYLVLPRKLTSAQWLLPGHGHPTPAAHALHARLVYRLLAPRAGWRALPEADEDAERYDRPPTGDWMAATAPMLRDMSRRQLSDGYVPSARVQQCLGGMACREGRLDRAGSLLLRRAEGATHLEIVLAPLVNRPHAYPMSILAEIPSAGGGTRGTVILAGDAEGRLTLPLPPDIAVEQALELVLTAERAVLGNQGLLGASAWVRSVRPVAGSGSSGR